MNTPQSVVFHNGKMKLTWAYDFKSCRIGYRPDFFLEDKYPEHFEPIKSK